MHEKKTNTTTPGPRGEPVTRRRFVQATTAAAVTAPLATATLLSGAPRRRADDVLNVGLVGCGGRGTGAAHNIIEASDRVRLHALADVFPDRLRGCRGNLESLGARAQVSESHCHVGFDAYQALIDDDVDIVLLATPPHFRPIHFEAAVRAGKHVFMEKPVATDPAGIRKVLAAAERAERQGLSVVAGTQRRHEASYRQTLEHLHNGAIGDITAARCYWNQGGLWVKPRQSEWTDMEWQLRNWLYFTWLSGDHIVEQHVHNLDVCNWAIGSHPILAYGMGGRQARTGPEYGNIFDHFAIEYEYPGGARVTSMCRQIDGTDGRVEEAFHGTAGRCLTRIGFAEIEGRRAWRFSGKNPNPYVQEHRDLLASITGEGSHCNEARQVAESTLTAIMGRMSAYTGKTVTWDQALASDLDLAPPAYEFGPLPVRPAAIPGKTKLT